MADLVWRDLAHMHGVECNLDAPRLLKSGAYRAQVWESPVDGRWRWGVLEWDSDTLCADLAAGKAAVQALNDAAHADGCVSTYTDTRGRPHAAPVPWPLLQERVQGPIDQFDREWEESRRKSGW